MRKAILEILIYHRQTSAYQVPQVIGQVCIDPRDQGLFIELRIKPEDHLAQKEIPEGIKAVDVHQAKWLDCIA